MADGTIGYACKKYSELCDILPRLYFCNFFNMQDFLCSTSDDIVIVHGFFDNSLVILGVYLSLGIKCINSFHYSNLEFINYFTFCWLLITLHGRKTTLCLNFGYVMGRSDADRACFIMSIFREVFGFSGMIYLQKPCFFVISQQKSKFEKKLVLRL